MFYCFLSVCPDDVIHNLGNKRVSTYIKTLKEINIAFIPYESQVKILENLRPFNINPCFQIKTSTEVKKKEFSSLLRCKIH